MSLLVKGGKIQKRAICLDRWSSQRNKGGTNSLLQDREETKRRFSSWLSLNFFRMVPDWYQQIRYQQGSFLFYSWMTLLKVWNPLLEIIWIWYNYACLQVRKRAIMYKTKIKSFQDTHRVWISAKKEVQVIKVLVKKHQLKKSSQFKTWTPVFKTFLLYSCHLIEYMIWAN